MCAASQAQQQAPIQQQGALYTSTTGISFFDVKACQCANRTLTTAQSLAPSFFFRRLPNTLRTAAKKTWCVGGFITDTRGRLSSTPSSTLPLLVPLLLSRHPRNMLFPFLGRLPHTPTTPFTHAFPDPFPSPHTQGQPPTGGAGGGQGGRHASLAWRGAAAEAWARWWSCRPCRCMGGP